MWGKKMAARWQVPAALTSRTDITIAGALKKQQTCYKIFSPKQYVTRGMIEVGDDDFEIVAYGDIAKTLAECRSGTFLTIQGVLTGKRWTTGDGKLHGLAQIRADQITVGPRLEAQQ